MDAGRRPVPSHAASGGKGCQVYLTEDGKEPDLHHHAARQARRWMNAERMGLGSSLFFVKRKIPSQIHRKGKDINGWDIKQSMVIDSEAYEEVL